MATFAEDLVAVSQEVDLFEEKKVVNCGFPLLHYIQELFLSVARFLRYRAKLEAGKMDFTLVEKLKVLAGACRELYSISSVVVFPTSTALKAWGRLKKKLNTCSILSRKPGSMHVANMRICLLLFIQYIMKVAPTVI